MFCVKLFVHSLVDKLKWFYQNARCYNTVYNCISLSLKFNIVISCLSALCQDNDKCHSGEFWVTSRSCTFSAPLTHVHCFTVCFWRDSPHWARASSFTRFLDYIQWRTTVGRTPLDEWSAHCRDLYLTKRNTHKTQTAMRPVGFEPTISAGERPQTNSLDGAATGAGILYCSCVFRWLVALVFLLGNKYGCKYEKNA